MLRRRAPTSKHRKAQSTTANNILPTKSSVKLPVSSTLTKGSDDPAESAVPESVRAEIEHHCTTTVRSHPYFLACLSAVVTTRRTEHMGMLPAQFVSLIRRDKTPLGEFFEGNHEVHEFVDVSSFVTAKTRIKRRMVMHQQHRTREQLAEDVEAVAVRKLLAQKAEDSWRYEGRYNTEGSRACKQTKRSSAPTSSRSTTNNTSATKNAEPSSSGLLDSLSKRLSSVANTAGEQLASGINDLSDVVAMPSLPFTYDELQPEAAASSPRLHKKISDVAPPIPAQFRHLQDTMEYKELEKIIVEIAEAKECVCTMVSESIQKTCKCQVDGTMATRRRERARHDKWCAAVAAHNPKLTKQTARRLVDTCIDLSLSKELERRVLIELFEFHFPGSRNQQFAADEFATSNTLGDKMKSALQTATTHLSNAAMMSAITDATNEVRRATSQIERLQQRVQHEAKLQALVDSDTVGTFNSSARMNRGVMEEKKSELKKMASVGADAATALKSKAKSMFFEPSSPATAPQNANRPTTASDTASSSTCGTSFAAPASSVKELASSAKTIATSTSSAALKGTQKIVSFITKDSSDKEKAGQATASTAEAATRDANHKDEQHDASPTPASPKKTSFSSSLLGQSTSSPLSNLLSSTTCKKDKDVAPKGEKKEGEPKKSSLFSSSSPLGKSSATSLVKGATSSLFGGGNNKKDKTKGTDKEPLVSTSDKNAARAAGEVDVAPSQQLQQDEEKKPSRPSSSSEVPTTTNPIVSALSPTTAPTPAASSPVAETDDALEDGWLHCGNGRKTWTYTCEDDNAPTNPTTAATTAVPTLFYHTPTGWYYDPTIGQWYSPDTEDWSETPPAQDDKSLVDVCSLPQEALDARAKHKAVLSNGHSDDDHVADDDGLDPKDVSREGLEMAEWRGWVRCDDPDFIYSKEEEMHYHLPSGWYYDGEKDLWCDPETGEWGPDQTS